MAPRERLEDFDDDRLERIADAIDRDIDAGTYAASSGISAMTACALMYE